MKKTIKESTVLFLSIIKWIFLATVAGAIVGGATALFLKLLAWATKIGQESSYVFLLLPLKD
jgi:H+/Cl- antiporter ClcA